MSEAGHADAPLTARVVANYGRHYLIESAAGALLAANRRGKRADVAVGDQVRYQQTGAEQAVIDEILPRRSLLFRADAQRTKEMASNVDQVAIVFAPQPTFNIRFVWRALAAARAAAIESLVILNKSDLPGIDAANARLQQLRALGHRTLALSVKRGPDDALHALSPLLIDRATFLVGQSGMGKSSLLNLLVPQADVRTQEFSRHLNLGRQTTTSTRWFALKGGGAVVDSPGFQAFGLSGLDFEGIIGAFPEFGPHLGQCRFLDCHHVTEPDCAIRAAVDRGDIDAQRYAFYRELLTECLP
jgi:ribosome biogenesis GTPase / thiamine phosphate phosphatase